MTQFIGVEWDQPYLFDLHEHIHLGPKTVQLAWP